MKIELFPKKFNAGIENTSGDMRMLSDRGVPGFGRGGAKFFFLKFGNLHVALLGGFGGMPPREIFLKWCNLVRFGVYLDQILSLKNFKNYHFLYKRINILDTRNIILVKKKFEIFMTDAFWYLF